MAPSVTLLALAAAVALSLLSSVRVAAQPAATTPLRGYNPAVWLGVYTARGCDQSVCCCMTSVNIEPIGSSVYSVSGSLAGQCGGGRSAATALPLPTSDTVSYSITAAAQQHTVTRDPATGVLTDVVAGSGRCSAVWTAGSSAGGDDGGGVVSSSTGRSGGASSTGSSGGGAASSTGSGGGAVVFDPTVWLGEYTSSGCSQSSCCCLTSASIARYGPAALSLTGSVSGQCGDVEQSSFAFSMPAGDSFTYSLAGESHTATRNPTTGIISDVNARSSSCNALLTKGSSDGGSSVMTIATYSESACSTQLGSVTLPKDTCVSGTGDYAIGSCSGNSWTIKGFRTSRTCSGAADVQASGNDRNTCAPFADGFIRVACDGSAIYAFDASEWLGAYVASGCDTSQCCCPTTAHFSTMGESWPLSALIAGQCGGATQTIGSAHPAEVWFHADEHEYEGKRTASGSIVFVDEKMSQCGGVLTKISSGGGSGSTSADLTVGVYADAACSQQLSLSTQRQGACQRSQVAGTTVFITARCDGDSWLAQAFLSDTCTGLLERTAASVGRDVCAFTGDVFVRVACDGSSLSPAARTEPGSVRLALLLLALTAAIAGQMQI